MNVTDRISPQSIDAEMSLLGSLMLDNEKINIISITGTEFYKTAHRVIFETIREMVHGNIAVDLTTLSDELKTKKRLDDIGGAYYLTELCETVPSATNILEYETIIKSKWRLRQLIELGHDLQMQAHEGREDINEIINDATDKLISLSIVENEGDHISDCLHAFNDRVDRRKAGEIVSVKVPLIGEIELGETATLAARPSVGKSALATQILFGCGVPAGYITLESTKEAVTGRMLAQVTEIDSTRLKYGNVKPEELEYLIERSDALASANIWMENKYDKIAEILALAYKWKAQHDIKLLVVDYIQLIDGGKAESENVMISNISRQITRFGNRNNVTILSLSQLSRAGIDRPQLHHLRGSGSLEQDSDMVIFLHRLEGKVKENVDLIIAKNKNGPLIDKSLHFQPEILTFSEGLQ